MEYNITDLECIIQLNPSIEKKQLVDFATLIQHLTDDSVHGLLSVSYTHLTLPTN